jgi:hypothetical protein
MHAPECRVGAIAASPIAPLHHVVSLGAQNRAMSTASYTPGVCNIGPAERRVRLLSGWIGTALVLVALVCFTVFDAPTWIRPIVFFPAVLAATGFLQYALHFCVNFAMRGLYNVGTALRNEENVIDAAMRKADQRKGLQIIALAVLISAAVVVIALLLP